jgi:HlyD family secretion protein
MNTRIRITKKLIAGVLSLLVVAAVIFLFATNRFASLLTRRGESTGEVLVAPRSLSFWVEANGVLRATSVQNYGGPPAFGRYWQFQIVSMAQEGKNVKKGDLLVSFDAQRIGEDLQRFSNELDQANKELEKTKSQIDLERQELTAKLAAAQNKLEKLRLKQKTSPTIDSPIEVETDELRIEQAKREVEALNQQLEWHKKSSEANYKIIASKKARAEGALNEIKAGMENFQAKADRDGVLVYKTKWNGERYQVGESIWSGQPLIEIPDLNTILAEAFVPEVDIGRVKVGQETEITIDAFPGKTYAGKVSKMGTLIRPKAWDIQNKVLDVQVTLDNLDVSIMRPGMSVKTKVVTATLDNCIAIPIKAIRTTADGSVVKVKSETGWTERKVMLGDSNGTDIVITDGLKPGERIASDFSKAHKGE